MAEPTVQDRLAELERQVAAADKSLALIALTLNGSPAHHLDGLAERVRQQEEKTAEVEGRTRATAETLERDLFKTRIAVFVFAFCGILALLSIIAVLVEYNGGIIP
jgi:hypothetical protein